jgi:hypothetical protein
VTLQIPDWVFYLVAGYFACVVIAVLANIAALLYSVMRRY